MQVFDSFAGELGPILFSKFELPVLKQIAKEVKDKLIEANIEPVPMVSIYPQIHIQEFSSGSFYFISIYVWFSFI